MVWYDGAAGHHASGIRAFGWEVLPKEDIDFTVWLSEHLEYLERSSVSLTSSWWRGKARWELLPRHPCGWH